MKYKEIFRLKEMLETEGIPLRFFDRSNEAMNFESWQLVYPDVESYDDNRICSVIEGVGSYGQRQDLLEIRGLLTEEEEKEDSVRGWLTAENVFNRIKNHYEHIQED